MVSNKIDNKTFSFGFKHIDILLQRSTQIVHY